MARRSPFPKSLGDIVAGFIEAECVHGPGDVYGQSVRLTAEEHRFLDDAYAIDQQTGRRQTDIAVYSRRKGTRKSELGAWLVAVEAVGPCRAYLDAGEPVARPPIDPWIVCAATTEDQGDLVYGAFRSIVKASPRLEPFFDVGLEVTYLIGAPGKVELKQSRNPGALDGARPTFEVGDETHLWIEHRLLEAFATLRRNLRKRHAAQPWMFLPTTAYAPKQGSVAELLHRACGTRRGRARVGRIIFDHRQASLKWNLDDDEQLRLAIEEAGGDAHWSDTDSIVDEKKTATLPEFKRYWLNIPSTDDSDNWLSARPGAWDDCAAELAELEQGTVVVAGVDMALHHDSVAVTLVSQHDDRIRWTAKVWEADRGRIDHVEVFDWIAALPDTGLVVRAVTYDPRFFELPAQQLADLGFNVVEFPQSPERLTPACESVYGLIMSGGIVHDGDPLLAAHANNAAWREGERGRTLSKRKSDGHIDALIAGVMATFELLQPEPEDEYGDPNLW